MSFIYDANTNQIIFLQALFQNINRLFFSKSAKDITLAYFNGTKIPTDKQKELLVIKLSTIQVSFYIENDHKKFSLTKRQFEFQKKKVRTAGHLVTHYNIISLMFNPHPTCS